MGAPATGSFRSDDLPHGNGGRHVIHVDADNLATRRDGSCWAHAYRDLAEAWDKLNDTTNTLWVAAGVYACGKTLAAEHSELNVLGGFAGEETSPDQRDLVANATRLVGYKGKDLRQSYRLMDVAGERVTLDGLTFAGCVFRRDREGGTVRSRAGELRLLNCTFATNAASRLHVRGGALHVLGNAVVSNCVFQGNVSGAENRGEGDGGAIYFEKDGGRVCERRADKPLRRPRRPWRNHAGIQRAIGIRGEHQFDTQRSE